MFIWIVPLIGWGVLAGALSFAWIKGGPAERFGSLLVLCGFIYALVIHFFAPTPAQPVLLLAGEGALSVGFLILAMRYLSAWLGGAMLLQAVQFSLHAFYFVSEKSHDPMYVAVNNLDSFGVMACILAGTYATWRTAKRKPSTSVRS